MRNLFFVVAAISILSTSALGNSDSGFLAHRRTVIATGYCPCAICCKQYHKNAKTKTGRSAKTVGVAVDSSVIPLGSRLDIPNYGNWVLADDIGGKIRGNRIDVRFQTHKEAVDWGVKKIEIRVWVKK